MRACAAGSAVGTDWPREASGLAKDMAIKIVNVRMYLLVLVPSEAMLFTDHRQKLLRASYLFFTEWISAMYPPGNWTTTASRSSVSYGGTSTSTPLAFALVSVSVRFVTSYPVVSLPYGYGR